MRPAWSRPGANRLTTQRTARVLNTTDTRPESRLSEPGIQANRSPSVSHAAGQRGRSEFRGTAARTSKSPCTMMIWENCFGLSERRKGKNVNNVIDFPAACLIGYDVVLFDTSKIPGFIRGQYAHAKEVTISGYGDDPPAMPRWAEAEKSANPIKNRLPLRPFETGTLLDVVYGYGVYAVWRSTFETPVWMFVIVSPSAVDRGYAEPGNGARWFNTCRLRESRVWEEADHAWQWIEKICREMAEKGEE